MEKNPSLISNAAEAYNAIQNYYHICLPHAIEGVVLQKVADSVAVSPKAGMAPPPAAKRAAARALRRTAPSGSLNDTPLLK